jgi:hypothetical protein
MRDELGTAEIEWVGHPGLGRPIGRFVSDKITHTVLSTPRLDGNVELPTAHGFHVRL